MWNDENAFFKSEQHHQNSLSISYSFDHVKPIQNVYKCIPKPAKQVGEFIKNGHEKISPTRIESGSGVTLSLCGQ